MDLTIIILTTDGREKLLRRALKYYTKLNCRIIIVDGGESKKSFKTFSKVDYYFLPSISFHKRLLFALKKSKTNYVINSQDDDFINLFLIRKGIKILNKHRKIAWVGGNQIYFKAFFGLYFLEKIQNNFVTNQNFFSNNIINRVLFFFEYQPQLYASLFRKKALISAVEDFLRTVGKKKYQKLVELPYSLFMSYRGCYHHFDDIWQFRDGSMNFNLNNDYVGFLSRLDTSLPKNIYKKSNEYKIIKISIFKNLKKKISKVKLNKLLHDIVDKKYSQHNFTDLSKKKFFEFKDILNKKFNLIFIFLKKINYLLSFIFILIKNFLFISIKNPETIKSWVNIKFILKNS